MRDKEKDAAQMALKRQKMLEEAYRLFSDKGIDFVSMPDVAKASGCGIATLYRYFNTKLALVIEVGIWAWQRVLSETINKATGAAQDTMTAAQLFETYLDFFLDLYRHHSDLLRFNQFFNIYVRGEGASVDQMSRYTDMIEEAEKGFHSMYRKAKKDGTVRTDISEEKLFSSTLHIMLAAVTRYAVGLVYMPGGGSCAEDELVLLKNLLLKEYATGTSPAEDGGILAWL